MVVVVVVVVVVVFIFAVLCRTWVLREQKEGRDETSGPVSEGVGVNEEIDGQKSASKEYERMVSKLPTEGTPEFVFIN